MKLISRADVVLALMKKTSVGICGDGAWGMRYTTAGRGASFLACAYRCRQGGTGIALELIQVFLQLFVGSQAIGFSRPVTIAAVNHGALFNSVTQDVFKIVNTF